MYRFAASDRIFDGVSNIYLISSGAAFVAVSIALYCSNFLKDEREKQVKKVLDEVEEEDDDTYSPANVSTSESELERLICSEDESFCDCNSGSVDDITQVTVKVHELVSKMKSNRLKELEGKLTQDQLEEEKRIEREQLAVIFELLKLKVN